MSMEVRQAVCHNCPDRKFFFYDDGTPYNCHNHCEKYAEEVRQCREMKEKIEKKSLSYKLCMDYGMQKSERLNKRYNRRKG